MQVQATLIRAYEVSGSIRNVYRLDRPVQRSLYVAVSTITIRAGELTETMAFVSDEKGRMGASVQDAWANNVTDAEVLAMLVPDQTEALPRDLDVEATDLGFIALTGGRLRKGDGMREYTKRVCHVAGCAWTSGDWTYNTRDGRAFTGHAAVAHWSAAHAE